MRREYARLEQELQGKEYEILLQELKKKSSFFDRFDTWAGVVDFMRDDTLNVLADEVLRPIFKAHAANGDHRWRTILLVIFWPGLETIYSCKRRWDRDHQERWQNIIWTFLKVVCRINVEHRQERLVQKVINDTIHNLHDEYRRTWKIKTKELTLENDDELELLIGGEESIGFAIIELHEKYEIEAKKLRIHVDEGRISEADFLLLVGTRVYGKSVADYAREAGIDYQVAKKRRQRAESAIHSRKTLKAVP